MKKLYLLTIFAVLFAFAGCKKASETDTLMYSTPPGGPVANLSIRSFQNIDALNVEVVKTLAFTYEELVAYENSISFNSFGKLAEQAMMPILAKIEIYCLEEETPARTTEVQNMLIANSKFLQVINNDGEDYCETRYYRSSFRYIMNSQCIFKVDTFYYKVFETGHVYCGVSNYSRLLNMSETEFSMLEDNDIFTVYKYPEPTRGNYGKSIEKKAQSGQSIVKVNIDFTQESKQTVGNNDVYKVYWNVTVKGYIRFLWINWPNKTTHEIKIPTSKFNEYNSVNNGIPTNASQIAYKLTRTLRSATVTVPKGANPNIYIHTIIGECRAGKASYYFNLN